MAGAMASTSFGLMTMPLTPWVIAASTSAVCLGEETWPSLSITPMPCFSASALNAFIMWTKNGKVRPGTEARIWSSAWATGAVTTVSAKALATTSLLVYLRIEWILP